MMTMLLLLLLLRYFLTLIHCGYQDHDVEVDGREDISASPQSAPLERRPVSSEIDFFFFLSLFPVVFFVVSPVLTCVTICLTFQNKFPEVSQLRLDLLAHRCCRPRGFPSE